MEMEKDRTKEVNRKIVVIGDVPILRHENTNLKCCIRGCDKIGDPGPSHARFNDGK